jgi:CPA1 family monovalent cation:H+ antiporter
MGQAEIVVVGLLVAVAALSALARRLSLPYPMVLVLGGALLGFVPGLPEVRLDPEVVLLVFLPRCCTAPRSSPTSTTSAATCAGWPSTP